MLPVLVALTTLMASLKIHRRTGGSGGNSARSDSSCSPPVARSDGTAAAGFETADREAFLDTWSAWPSPPRIGWIAVARRANIGRDGQPTPSWLAEFNTNALDLRCRSRTRFGSSWRSVVRWVRTSFESGGLGVARYVGSPVELPTYRKIPHDRINGSPARADQWLPISPHLLPDFARLIKAAPLTSSVRRTRSHGAPRASEGGYSQALAAEGPEPRGHHELRRQDTAGHIAAITGQPAPSLEGALDQIRTSLVELVAEMRADA